MRLILIPLLTGALSFWLTLTRSWLPWLATIGAIAVMGFKLWLRH